LDFLENSQIKEIVDIPYKVKFQYGNEKKRKILVGKYFESFWHLGISLNVKLFPVLAYEVKSHIVFSDDGIHIWDDSAKLHRARRNKGKRFFNEEWRDLLFAFLNSLRNDSNLIKLPLTNDKSILLSPIPIHFTSHSGYLEPNSNARLIPINEFIDDEDDNESDIDNDTSERLNDADS